MGMISAGSLDSRWASSSLYEMRCATSMSHVYRPARTFSRIWSLQELAQGTSRQLGAPIDEAVIHPEFDDEVDQLLLNVRAIFVVIAPVEGL